MRPSGALLVASPAFLIGALGLAHPLLLTPATAERWQVVHLALLPAFPLLAGSFLWLLRREWGVIGWLARLSAYGYAVLYGALDAIAGIGAPQQVRHARQPPINDLYEIGDRLGHVGVVCLAITALLTAGLVWRVSRRPLPLLAGAVGAVSCLPFYRHHVFRPWGVLALIGLGVALLLLSIAQESAAEPR